MNCKGFQKYQLIEWTILLVIILVLTTPFPTLGDEEYRFERILPIEPPDEVSESSYETAEASPRSDALWRKTLLNHLKTRNPQNGKKKR